MIKWTKKDAVNAIAEDVNMPSPLEKGQAGKTNQLSPNITGMRSAKPLMPMRTPTKPPIGR